MSSAKRNMKNQNKYQSKSFNEYGEYGQSYQSHHIIVYEVNPNYHLMKIILLS